MNGAPKWQRLWDNTHLVRVDVLESTLRDQSIANGATPVVLASQWQPMEIFWEIEMLFLVACDLQRSRAAYASLQRAFNEAVRAH
jgi:hypothetical protein